MTVQRSDWATKSRGKRDTSLPFLSPHRWKIPANAYPVNVLKELSLNSLGSCVPSRVSHSAVYIGKHKVFSSVPQVAYEVLGMAKNVDSDARLLGFEPWPQWILV